MKPGTLVLMATLVVACRKEAVEAVAPQSVESIGAPDYFGRGIVRLGELADRVLVDVSVPAFWALVRFNSLGDVMAASASEVRRDPGMRWLPVPAGREAAARTTAVVANPFCADNTSRGRRECAAQPRVFETGPPPMQAGETLILFVSVEPLRPATIEDRLNRLPAGAQLARVPTFLMAERSDVWAAYVYRRL